MHRLALSRRPHALASLLALAGLLLGLSAAHAQPPQPTAGGYQAFLPFVARGGSAAGATPTPTQPPASPTPSPPAEPLALVQVAYDAARAASAPIGPEGGAVSASAADGTRYTLAIPADALDFSEVITLTPALAVANLPLSGGLAGAVGIEPAGLAFIGSATLTIAPAVAPAGPIALGFGFEGAGERFHLKPLLGAPQLQAAGGSFSVSVPATRGYGAASGTQADIDRIKAQPRQLDPADSLDDLLVPLVPHNAAQQAADAFEATVYPALVAAVADPALADAALAGFDRWYTTIAQYSLDQAMGEQIGRANKQVHEIIGRASDAAAYRCVTQNRPEEGFRLLRLLKYARKQAGPSPALAAEVQAKLRNCLTFKVTMHTRITESDGKWGWTYVLHSEVTLRPAGGTRAVGSGPLTFDAVTWAGTPIPGCTLSGSGAPSTLDAASGSYGLSITPVSRTSPAVKVALRYDPGTPAERKTIVCDLAPGGEANTHQWRDYYEQMHVYERENGGFTAQATIVGAGSFEGWVYNHTGMGTEAPLTEQTEIEIKHTPDR